MRTRSVLVVFFLCISAAALGTTSADEARLDRYELKVARLPADQPLFIREFSTADTDFGTGENAKKEKAQELARTMREVAPPTLREALVTRLAESGMFPAVTVLEDGQPPEGALLLEGAFTVLNPGSRAKRYWVGMGAGKSKVCVSGQLVDGAGNPLGRFDHCRSGAIGVFGGNAAGMMSTDIHATGTRVADFLVAWAKGELPSKRE